MRSTCATIERAGLRRRGAPQGGLRNRLFNFGKRALRGQLAEETKVGHSRNMGGVVTLWPSWCRTVDGAIQTGAVVRACCRDCGTIFDVDLRAILNKRGPRFSLINQHTQCRISRCRGRAYFIAVAGMDQPYQLLMAAGDPDNTVVGQRPIDLEPDWDPPGGAAARAA